MPHPRILVGSSLAEGANLPDNSCLRACLGGIRARDRRLAATGSTRSAAVEAAPGAIVGEVTAVVRRIAFSRLTDCADCEIGGNRAFTQLICEKCRSFQ